MEARATANTVLTAPIKSRIVIDLIRGKKVSEADNILNNLNKKSARLIRKVLISAVANAENNLGLEKDKLYVKEIYANEGVKMKRFMPRAKGRASGLVKKTSHINVVVAER